MRTLYIPEKGKLVFMEKAMPVCSATGILIRTRYSGLSNGTERNFLLGGNYGGSFPRYPGYQVVGDVVECGSKVSGFVPGDTVFCANTGFGHWEYLPAETNSLLVKLNDQDDLEAIALLAIASVAWRNTMRLGIRTGEKVLVFGGAVIGQVAAQIALNQGAHVTLIASDPDKLKTASACGVNKVLDRKHPEFARLLEEGKPWDAVIETSGADILDTIIGIDWNGGLLANEGRLALVAGRQQIVYSSNAAQSKALAIYQSAHFKQHHLNETLAQIRSGNIRMRPLIRDVVPISDAIAIYERLRDNPSSLFGTVFKW